MSKQTGISDQLPEWTNGVEVPDPDYNTLMELIIRWNEEQVFIEKYIKDPFIIYGHVRAQEDIVSEILVIYKKHENAIN